MSFLRFHDQPRRPEDPESAYSEAAEKAAELRGQIEQNREAVANAIRLLAELDAKIKAFAEAYATAAAAGLSEAEQLKPYIDGQVAFRERMTAALAEAQAAKSRLEADINQLESRDAAHEDRLRQAKFSRPEDRQ